MKLLFKAFLGVIIVCLVILRMNGGHIGVKINSVSIVKFSILLGYEFSQDSSHVAYIAHIYKFKHLTDSQLEMLDVLLTNGVSVDAIGEFSSRTALMSLANKLDSRGVEYLLKAGANANASNDFGHTAAMYVCSQSGGDSLQILELLVQYQADLSLKAHDGETCLSSAENHWRAGVKKGHDDSQLLEFIRANVHQ